MSLAELLGADLDDEDEDEDDDEDYEEGQDDDEQTPSTSQPPASQKPRGNEQFGVPYDTFDDDDERGPSDEVRFSNERFFSPRLQELLNGSMLGGAPTSQTGLLTGVRPMLLHQTQSQHPERPARMVAIYHELIERGLDARSRLVPVRLASREDLQLVHTPDQVAKSTARYASDEAATAALELDSDTYFAASDSGRAAMLSAGSAVELTTRVVQGELRNALAVVRPPGHHCESKQAMGFCLLNNVCVAVAVARRRLGVSRVMIVDWDVHHGNGVQHIFEDDPTVLYVSLHRFESGFYPGTGHPGEVGVDAGEGTSINVAFTSEGYGDAEYLAAFNRLIMPIATEFCPDLVIVSAGFDAAQGDPLGGMTVSPAGYSHMTALLATLAGGRLVIALEGGYDLKSVSQSAAAVHATLLGDALPRLERRAPLRQALGDIERTVDIARRYWACLQPPSPPPREEAKDKRRRIAVGGALKNRKRIRGPWWYRFMYP